jgi:hypothetical protein
MPITAALLTIYDGDSYTQVNKEATAKWLDDVKDAVLNDRLDTVATFRRYFYDKDYDGPETVTERVGKKRVGIGEYARDPFPPHN